MINISENAYTNEDLKVMQNWDLNRKIQVAQTRIMEWYMKHDNKCYVSFSGGKDSTVLADMAAKVCKMLDCKLVLWFSDTGLEFPEIRGHVKTFGKYLEDRYDIEVETIMEYPTDRKGKRVLFRDVILNEGGTKKKILLLNFINLKNSGGTCIKGKFFHKFLKLSLH